jgi:preprotein translocase subunit YajC
MSEVKRKMTKCNEKRRDTLPAEITPKIWNYRIRSIPATGGHADSHLNRLDFVCYTDSSPGPLGFRQDGVFTSALPPQAAGLKTPQYFACKDVSMNSIVFPLLMAGQQAAGDGQGGPLGGMMSFLPFVAIIGIFYFLIIRPQNKKQKDTQKMLSALKKGDKVVTIGGVHGTIQSVRESSVIVKVDENTKIEFSRSAISGVEAAAKEDKTEKIESTEAKSADAATGGTDSAAGNPQ